MKIFCIGDIMGAVGRDMLAHNLKNIIEQYNIDAVVANGENAAHGIGITKNVYEQLCDMGVNAITLGNHTWGCKDVVPLLRYKDNIIRPANFDGDCPGRGSTVITAGAVKIGIINVIGRTYMNPCACPFECARKEAEKLRKITPVVLVDFHAEATSEKAALGWYLDGKVSALFGTHTHIQTADETVLPKGTGYITDLGMTGPEYSVLGMDRHIVIDKFIKSMPQKFTLADGKGQICGAVFEIEANSGKCIGVERIFIRE